MGKKRAERRDRRWSVRACPATGMRIWHRQRGRPVACGLPSRQEHLQRHRISDPYPVSPPDFHPQRHFGSSSLTLKDMYILWKLAEKWIVSSANYLNRHCEWIDHHGPCSTEAWKVEIRVGRPLVLPYLRGSHCLRFAACYPHRYCTISITIECRLQLYKVM